MEWLFSWLEALVSWFVTTIKDVFKAAWDFIKDIAIELLDLLLQAVVSLVSSIPVPEFLQDYSVGNLIGALPDAALFFLGKLRIGECFAILGVAFAFRMTRKLFTFGQW